MMRRTVLGAMAAAPFAASAARAGLAPSRPLIVNTLGELSDPNFWGQETGELASDRVIRDAIASGTCAINLTLGYVSGEEDPFEQSVRDIARWDEVIRRRPASLMKVYRPDDIETAHRLGKIGIIFGFQNAAMMGNDASRVDVFDDLGVRIIQLTYNIRNQLGGGSLAPEDTPLSPFGHEVVERLNARRIMVDLSHSGRRTCLDAARAASAPICISHTGCRALVDYPRNKSDEELKLVADKGGFVGIYFMPFLAHERQITSADVIAHIEHAIDVCGEDHVGIGTDGSTTAIDDMKRWAAAFAEDIERRRAAGISAAGERPDSFLFAIDMRGPEQFRILADKMRARGHSQRRIEKILGRNFLEYSRRIWGA